MGWVRISYHSEGDWQMAKLGITPTEDRVVIEPEDVVKVTRGGIILPDRVAEKPSRGQIVAVGPGRYSESGSLIPMALKLGQVVLFNEFSGSVVDVEGKAYRVHRQAEVLAVLS